MEETQMVIARGAESIIYRTTFYGMDAVVKERIPKNYRHPSIDLALRTARTRNEARLMHAARCAGVSTPIIFDIDECRIVMQYLNAKNLKACIKEMQEHEIEGILRKIGEVVARLHRNNIVHGDLTTSNMILYDGYLYLIDFSLGEKTQSIESKGVDLHLLREAFLSAHAEIFHMFNIILESYTEHYAKAQDVLARLKEIELRGRGHEREKRTGIRTQQ
jgi:TP53 regulating kinase-like protein